VQRQIYPQVRKLPAVIYCSKVSGISQTFFADKQLKMINY
jgi:hypothetical protein